MTVAEPPRFLVAPDSFKGTWTAPEVAAALAAGIESAGGTADRCPVADGGEGTMEVLLEALGGEQLTVTVSDPLRRPIEAAFGLLGDGGTAVVEMARASGLPLLAPGERDPERADTYGTGELIAAALEAGARIVLVAVGGSATSDGGRGVIEALGERGALAGSGDAAHLAARIEVLCDVETPFEQAARVFGPQKGADPAAVGRLTARLDTYAAELPRDPRGVPMSGAAGGLAGGLWAHGATLRPGAAYVLDAVGFDARLARADAAVGGEGRLDSQSFEGKIVGILAERCAAAGKPLHLVVGQNALAAPPAALLASIAEASTPQQMLAAGEELARFASS
jgi:glycerate kinase